jgi:hypothetical protein
MRHVVTQKLKQARMGDDGDDDREHEQGHEREQRRFIPTFTVSGY